MEKITSRRGRIFVHLALIGFAIYSIFPFVWTFLQSFKNLKDANSRTPKFIFTPTWENYQELWLREVPDNGALIGFFLILALVLLVFLLLFADRIPIKNSIIYGFGLLKKQSFRVKSCKTYSK